MPDVYSSQKSCATIIPFIYPHFVFCLDSTRANCQSALLCRHILSAAVVELNRLVRFIWLSIASNHGSLRAKSTIFLLNSSLNRSASLRPSLRLRVVIASGLVSGSICFFRMQAAPVSKTRGSAQQGESSPNHK